MAAPHVCILQTSFAKREDTIAFLKERVPGVRVEFITDSTLLADVRANGGPTQAVIDRCDYKLMIPMNPATESLNAGVSAAVILWEMARGH